MEKLLKNQQKRFEEKFCNVADKSYLDSSNADEIKQFLSACQQEWLNWLQERQWKEEIKQTADNLKNYG